MAKMYLILGCMFLSWHLTGQKEALYITQNGTVRFSSEAPLELIEAASDELQGVIDPTSNTFAFSVSVNSFKGFNNALQAAHFHENYMESSRYPSATFVGKIIEKVDLNVDGLYFVRAKGQLELHGATKERIIKCCVKVEGEKMTTHARFTLLLEEHHIDVPKIVHQKIATEIIVDMEAEFLKQKI